MTSIETGHSWSERLNPRNWTLTWKLVVVGLVPALLALVLGVLRVSDQAGEAAEVGRSTRLLEVQAQVAQAADVLRQERDEATLFAAGGRTGDRGVLDIGFAEADTEVDEMLSAVHGASELDPTTTAVLQQAEDRLALLPQLRTDASENPASDARQIRVRYDAVVEGIDVLDRAVLRQVRTPGVAGLIDALTEVTSAREQLAVQHTVLGAAIRAGHLTPEDASEVATDSELTTAYRGYQAALTPEQVTRFGNFLDDAANAQRERLTGVILATPPDQPIALPQTEWDTAYNGSRAAADRSAELLRNELVAESEAAEEQASNLAGINSVVLMLGLLIGIAVAVLIARALIRSLRVLRASALDVAERRLPLAVESMRAGQTPDVAVDPVPLTGRDEIGQVARAFDAVHGQAVRLAADQAALQAGVSAMFVNLSRRSQALVERQLQLIEQLESNEQDADQLANLFQLDHLATRMRRNSENLLVLAGTDLAKRNIAPVPMVDVLRAAVSEVESYQRIVVQTPPTATVAGRAASDVVHLLAELLDNATNFSPPDSQVVMSTARTTEGAVVVEIADRGVGMSEHELADANQRLAGPISVDVSASRRMGLFVVGRLAARHGIGVRLSASSSGGQAGGLTASVTVPAHLIPSIEPVEVSRTASLPLAAGAAGAPGTRPSVPPQRGINGAARSGGLSALVAGTDGPANPAGVFDAPSSDTGEGQLFTPPPNQNGSPTSLPTRRPGSSLRPDGPPAGPPERQDRSEQSGTGSDPSAEQQAREVAAQARRDQEAAARAAAARAEEQTRGRQPGTGQDSARGESLFFSGTPAAGPAVTNGHGHRPAGIGRPGGIDRQQADSGAAQGAGEQQQRPEQHRPEQGQDTQGPRGQGPAASGQPPASTLAGLPRRTPSRPGMPKPAHPQPDQPHTAQPQTAQPQAGQPRQEEQQRDDASDAAAAQPGSEQPGQAAPAQPDAAQQGAAQADAARPGAAQAEQVRSRPAPSPRPATLSQAPAEQGAQNQAAQNQAAQNQAEANLGEQTEQVRQTWALPAQLEQRATEQAPEAADAVQAQPVRAQPEQDEQPAQPSEQDADATVVSPPTMPMPAVRRPLNGAAAEQPAPRPTPRPTPRPAPQPAQDNGSAPRPEPADANRQAGPAPVPSDSGEGLFVPNVPVIAEPTGRAPGSNAPSGFELGETTPIFEEIASAWFRSNRQIPVNYQAGQGAAPAAGGAQPALPARPSPRPTPIPASPPTAEIPVAPVTPAAPPAPQQPAPAPQEEEFASTADEGWRAASGAVAERPDELTAAGLPKRRPRARLVPGSAGSAVLAPPAGTTRSAETIRGRLASYQQGVRQGRESRMRAQQQGSAHGANGGTGPANSGGNHDEESS